MRRSKFFARDPMEIMEWTLVRSPPRFKNVTEMTAVLLLFVRVSVSPISPISPYSLLYRPREHQGRSSQGFSATIPYQKKGENSIELVESDSAIHPKDEKEHESPSLSNESIIIYLRHHSSHSNPRAIYPTAIHNQSAAIIWITGERKIDS